MSEESTAGARPEVKSSICVKCLHEQASCLQPCEGCGSRQVVSARYLEFRLGKHYRELLRAELESTLH